MSTPETASKAMTKKEVKKMLKKAMKKAEAARNAAEAASKNAAESAKHQDEKSNAPAEAPRIKRTTNPSFLSNLGLPADFATGHTQQFIIGALIGAGAAWVLADEDTRKKIMKSVMKVYANVTGGVEEFKEQMSDLKAEIAAEHGL